MKQKKQKRSSASGHIKNECRRNKKWKGGEEELSRLPSTANTVIKGEKFTSFQSGKCNSLLLRDDDDFGAISQILKRGKEGAVYTDHNRFRSRIRRCHLQGKEGRRLFLVSLKGQVD